MTFEVDTAGQRRGISEESALQRGVSMALVDFKSRLADARGDRMGFGRSAERIGARLQSAMRLHGSPRLESYLLEECCRLGHRDGTWEQGGARL